MFLGQEEITDTVPLYDINKSYLENAEEGPFVSFKVPQRDFPDESKWLDFLGYKVASPIGVPAGPLLNSKWVDLSAQLGFDVVCYKTIRSQEHPGHALPNMVFVEADEQLIPESLPGHLLMRRSPPSEMGQLAVTNSFGMPSRSREYLSKDIARANSLLRRGQVMIVSVVGTPQPSGYEGFIEDFVTVSVQAKEYGAKIIEVNFSCPNVASGEGCLYTSPHVVEEITKRIVAAIGEIPLIVKVGTFADAESLKNTLLAVARGGAQAVCGINTISMKVYDPLSLEPALGPDRLTSGVCGNPIRQAAIDFTRSAREVIEKEKLGLVLMSTGGVVLPEHFDAFLNAGADVAMCASGMIWDPFIAMRYHSKEKQI